MIDKPNNTAWTDEALEEHIALLLAEQRRCRGPITKLASAVAMIVSHRNALRTDNARLQAQLATAHNKIDILNAECRAAAQQESEHEPPTPENKSDLG